MILFRVSVSSFFFTLFCVASFIFRGMKKDDILRKGGANCCSTVAQLIGLVWANIFRFCKSSILLMNAIFVLALSFAKCTTIFARVLN